MKDNFTEDNFTEDNFTKEEVISILKLYTIHLMETQFIGDISKGEMKVIAEKILKDNLEKTPTWIDQYIKD